MSVLLNSHLLLRKGVAMVTNGERMPSPVGVDYMLTGTATPPGRSPIASSQRREMFIA